MKKRYQSPPLTKEIALEKIKALNVTQSEFERLLGKKIAECDFEGRPYESSYDKIMFDTTVTLCRMRQAESKTIKRRK